MKTFNKKIVYKLTIVLVLLGVLACNNSDDIDLKLPSHRVIMTSEMDFNNTVEVNGIISFADISTGVVSRNWTFPSESNVITFKGNNANGSDNVKLQFTQVGQHNVDLTQTFKSDAFVGTTQQGTVLDTTIVVTVLSPVQASIRAFHINPDDTLGEELVIAENAENEVTASRRVRFTYDVDGEPQEFLWIFEGGDPATFEDPDTEVDVKYRSLGTYDLNFMATRSRPFGGDTLSFKKLIKVIPSTDPVTLDKVTEKNGKIALEFSRDMNPATLDASTFAINLANNGIQIPVSIASATIDPEAGNVVLLELLGDSVYNDDVVTVSYTQGILATLDAVVADAFTDVPLEFTLVNILDGDSNYDYSFENSTAGNWPYMWWGGIWGEYDLSISTTRAHTGNSSAYIEYRPGGGMIIGHTNSAGDQITFPAEAGKDYEIGVWVYVEDLGNSDPAQSPPDLRFYWWPDTNWGVGANPAFTSDFPTGEWVYSKIFVEFTQSGDKTFQIRGWNEFNPERLKFYIDDLSVSEVSLRP